MSTQKILLTMQEAVTTKTILKHAGYFIAFLIGAVELPVDAFKILGGLMVLDTILGVLRVGVVHGFIHIKSTRLTAGIISKLAVIAAPLVIAWTGKGAGIDLVPLAKGALSMIILAEGYSILGNINSIRLRKDVQEWDAVAFVLQKTRQTIEKILQQHDTQKQTKDTEKGPQ